MMLGKALTTAEAIEGITDTGKFEILATRVLRIEDEDCRFLVHLGVNALGAFCRILFMPLFGASDCHDRSFQACCFLGQSAQSFSLNRRHSLYEV